MNIPKVNLTKISNFDKKISWKQFMNMIHYYLSNYGKFAKASIIFKINKFLNIQKTID